MKTFPSKDAGEEDLQTDADEDDAAQNGCLAGQLGAELFADVQTGHAEDEGDCGDDDRCRQRHRPVVLRDGEADGKGVDAGGHALHEEGTGAQLNGLLGLFAPDALQQHLAANVRQQNEGDPGDEHLKGREQLDNGVDADPARHGHDRLKHTESARDDAHPPDGHFGVVQAVCHRDRERIHGKAHAQQSTVEEKQEIPFHTNTPPKSDRNLVRQKQNPESARVHVRFRVIFYIRTPCVGRGTRTKTHESRK